MIEIRQDLQEAINRAWSRLGRPGTWWTAKERVAIAAETRSARNCGMCQSIRRSETAIDEITNHGQLKGQLSLVAAELIHYVAENASMLSLPVYQSVLDRGLSDAHYVELVGVVSTVVGIDSFYRSLGLAPRELPPPVDGEPTRSRPSSARHDGAWVPMVAPEDLDAADSDIYTADRDGYVIRALSLVPEEVRSLIDQSQNFYVADLTDQDAGRSLSRVQIELVAARVSALNECFY